MTKEEAELWYEVEYLGEEISSLEAKQQELLKKLLKLTKKD